jgi:hypothetical protein
MANFPIYNAPQSLDMIDFESVSRDLGGLAKSCRFAAVIRPQGNALKSVLSKVGIAGVERDLVYLCEAAEFPGRGFQGVELRYYGPNFKMPYQSTYEDINMTFLCRNEGIERQFFDDWMEVINPTNTFDFEYRDNYRARIEIYHYNEEGFVDFFGNAYAEPQYAFTLNEAYPVLVNPQPVTWADDQFLRLGVTFTYSWWNRPNHDPVNKNTAGTDATFSLVPKGQVGDTTNNPLSRIGLTDI